MQELLRWFEYLAIDLGNVKLQIGAAISKTKEALAALYSRSEGRV